MFWWLKLRLTLSSIGEDGINETLIHGHYIPRHLAKRKENIYPRKHLYTNVHTSIIHISKTVETIQISSTGEWIKCGIFTQWHTQKEKEMNYW